MSDSDSDTDDEPASETERDAAVLDSDDDLSTTSSAEFTPSAAVSDAMAAMESVRARARATASALPDDAFPAAAVRAPLFDADESSPIAGIVGDAGSSDAAPHAAASPPDIAPPSPEATPEPDDDGEAWMLAVMARERRLLWGGGHGDPSARVLRPLRARRGARQPRAARHPAVRFDDSELLNARDAEPALHGTPSSFAARGPLIAVGTSRARVLLFRAAEEPAADAVREMLRRAWGVEEVSDPASSPPRVLGSEADAAAYGAVATVDIAPRPTPHARSDGKKASAGEGEGGSHAPTSEPSSSTSAPPVAPSSETSSFVVAAGYASGRIALFDGETGACVKALPRTTHTAPVIAVRFYAARDAALIAVDLTGRVTRVRFSRMVWSAYVADVEVRHRAFSPPARPRKRSRRCLQVLINGAAGSLPSLCVLPQSGGEEETDDAALLTALDYDSDDDGSLRPSGGDAPGGLSRRRRRAAASIAVEAVASARAAIPTSTTIRRFAMVALATLRSTFILAVEVCAPRAQLARAARSLARVGPSSHSPLSSSLLPLADCAHASLVASARGRARRRLHAVSRVGVGARRARGRRRRARARARARVRRARRAVARAWIEPADRRLGQRRVPARAPAARDV